jgi:hypothetical protein
LLTLEDRFERAFTTDEFDHWKMIVAKFKKHQASSSYQHANSLWLNARENYQNNNDVLNVGGAPDR